MLEALAHGVLALQVDLVRLIPAAELQHLLTGGTTCRLWPDRDGATEQHLAFRDASHIRAHPGRGLPVHDCDRLHGQPDQQLLHPIRKTTTTEEPTW